MKPDIYNKAVLAVIALLLAVSALRPVLIPRPVHATGHTYKVDTAYIGGGEDTETMLNKDSAEGWEPVTAWAESDNRVYVMFKK